MFNELKNAIKKMLSRKNAQKKFAVQSLVKTNKNIVIVNPLQIDHPNNITLGENIHIGDSSILSCFSCGQLKVGSNVWATRDLNIWCGENIVIGDDVLIGSFVLITDLSHGMNPLSKLNYQNQKILTNSVKIGTGVWIGDKVSILPGAKIGEKSIIGANSVVTGEIPSYCIAVGNPAKIIKNYDFDLKLWVKINE